MSGIITLTACNSPTVKEPVESFVTSNKFQVYKSGNRTLDYKQSRELVGEWVSGSVSEPMPLEEMPDSVCFSLESWLTKIKPKLKDGHDFWNDYNGTKR